MLKYTIAGLLFLFFFIMSGCNSGPYNVITVETGWGQEKISSYCSAWTDGCNIGCRTNNTTGYTIIPVKENCKDTDIHRAQCIDEDPVKIKICDNISNNKNSDY